MGHGNDHVERGGHSAEVGPGLRRIDTEHAAVAVWPLTAEVTDASLLEAALPLSGGDGAGPLPWPPLHSAWLCPEIPFVFELGTAARAELGTGRLPQADSVLRHALATFRTRFGDRHARTAEALTALGSVLTERGRLAEADSLLRLALGVRETLFAAGDLRTAETRQALGLAVAKQGRRREADSLLRMSCRDYDRSPWAGARARECRAARASPMSASRAP